MGKHITQHYCRHGGVASAISQTRRRILSFRRLRVKPAMTDKSKVSH